jgi:hypothetical protein
VLFSRHRLAAFGDLQGERQPAVCQLDIERPRRRCSAMLYSEGERIAVTAQIEIAVAPGVELGEAAQRLTGTHTAATRV